MVNRCVFLGNMFFFVGQIQREKQHRNQLGLLSSKKSGRSLRRRPPSIISSKHGSSYWCVLRREWGNDPSHHYIVMSSPQQPPATHPFPTFSTSKSWMFPEGGLERGCGHNWIKSMKWTVLVGGLEHLFFFPFRWECHNPNWRTPSFFRGVKTTKRSPIWILQQSTESAPQL